MREFFIEPNAEAAIFSLRKRRPPAAGSNGRKLGTSYSAGSCPEYLLAAKGLNVRKLRCPYNDGVEVSRAGRILAIDYGSRRMGLAVSDPLGITAQGLETLERKNKRSDFARLEKTIRNYQVCEIVLGYPLRMSGEEGAQSQTVSGFAEQLRKKFQLPVHLWDERLTSAEANRVLREADLSIKKRAQAVDRMAAVLILQAFLQSRTGPGTST